MPRCVEVYMCACAKTANHVVDFASPPPPPPPPADDDFDDEPPAPPPPAPPDDLSQDGAFDDEAAPPPEALSDEQLQVLTMARADLLLLQQHKLKEYRAMQMEHSLISSNRRSGVLSTHQTAELLRVATAMQTLRNLNEFISNRLGSAAEPESSPAPSTSAASRATPATSFPPASGSGTSSTNPSSHGGNTSAGMGSRPPGSKPVVAAATVWPPFTLATWLTDINPQLSCLEKTLRDQGFDELRYMALITEAECERLNLAATLMTLLQCKSLHIPRALCLKIVAHAETIASAYPEPDLTHLFDTSSTLAPATATATQASTTTRLRGHHPQSAPGFSTWCAAVHSKIVGGVERQLRDRAFDDPQTLPLLTDEDCVRMKMSRGLACLLLHHARALAGRTKFDVRQWLTSVSPALTDPGACDGIDIAGTLLQHGFTDADTVALITSADAKAMRLPPSMILPLINGVHALSQSTQPSTFELKSWLLSVHPRCVAFEESFRDLGLKTEVLVMNLTAADCQDRMHIPRGLALLLESKAQLLNAQHSTAPGAANATFSLRAWLTGVSSQLVELEGSLRSHGFDDVRTLPFLDADECARLNLAKDLQLRLDCESMYIPDALIHLLVEATAVRCMVASSHHRIIVTIFLHHRMITLAYHRKEYHGDQFFPVGSCFFSILISCL
jgi:hypothetical protein